MSRSALLVLAIAMAPLLFAQDATQDAVKKELAKLEGTWTVVSEEVDGVNSGEDRIEQLGTVTFKDGKYTWANGGEGTINVNPTKKPKQVDYSIVDSQGLVHIYDGIYELDGDTYRYCFARPGMPRPTEFKTAADSGLSMMVLKRAKKQ